MTRKKLFILSLIGFLLIPVYWVASSTYERYQISARAEALFKEIPTYPGATPIEKSLSFSTIGFGYRYSVADDPVKIEEFFLLRSGKEWILEQKINSTNNKDLIYKHESDNFKLTISVSKSDNLPLTSPPYDLTVRVHKP